MAVEPWVLRGLGPDMDYHVTRGACATEQGELQRDFGLLTAVDENAIIAAAHNLSDVGTTPTWEPHGSARRIKLGVVALGQEPGAPGNDDREV